MEVFCLHEEDKVKEVEKEEEKSRRRGMVGLKKS